MYYMKVDLQSFIKSNMVGSDMLPRHRYAERPYITMAKGSLQVYLTGRKRYRSSVVRFHILYSPYRVTAAICYHSEFSSVGSMSASFEIPRGGESHLLRAEMPSCLVPTGCTLRSNKVFPGATGAGLSVQLRLSLQEINEHMPP